MYSVYALMDPRDDGIRYIGMSKNVWRRYAMHLLIPSKTTPSKNAWIEELRRIDLSPLLKILDTANTEEEAGKRETYWIQHYLDRKVPLLNIAKIGEKRVLQSREGMIATEGVARYLGLSEVVVKRLFRRQDIKAIRVEGVYLTRPELVDEYLEKHLNTNQQDTQAE